MITKCGKEEITVLGDFKRIIIVALIILLAVLLLTGVLE